MIPITEHSLWPYFRTYGFAADQLVPADLALPVAVPKEHGDVYVFETHQEEKITFYRSSYMIAVRGVLYCIFFEQNNPFGERSTFRQWTCTVIRGILTIKGPNAQYIKGIRTRPSVPWYTPEFEKIRKHSQLDIVNDMLARIQRWARKELTKKKTLMLWTVRHHGWFALLCDDVFIAVVDRVVHWLDAARLRIDHRGKV
jgi:hypothetical protein